MKSSTLFISYISFSLLYLLIILLGREDIAWFIKPLLIPFLIVGVHFYNAFTTKKLLLTALLFSWIGDIILLFTNTDTQFFILGLVAFLISYVAYVLLLNRQLKLGNIKNKAIYWIGVTMIIIYLLVVLTILSPELGDLKISVLVYAIVISTLLLFAFKGFLIWKEPANWYILTAAILFVSSDSILAFNTFYEPIILSSFLIMMTYLVAHYLIVIGILKLNQKN